MASAFAWCIAGSRRTPSILPIPEERCSYARGVIRAQAEHSNKHGAVRWLVVTHCQFQLGVILMKLSLISKLLFALTLTAAAALPAFAQSTLIAPSPAALPAVFPIGQPASTLLTITNGDPSASTQILPGDTFTFTFDATLMATVAASGPVIINSSSLVAGDFTYVVNAAARTVVITYGGVQKAFNSAHILAIKLTFTPPRP